MEKQTFYSSNFMPNPMEMKKPLVNKYTDCLYPMQPMMPQPTFVPSMNQPQKELFQPMMQQPLCVPSMQKHMVQQQPFYQPHQEMVKSSIPQTQPMYGYHPHMMPAPQMQAPVSMESMYLMDQPDIRNRKSEEEKPKQVIPVKPIKLPEVKPQPTPEFKPIPQPQQKPIMISIKKTHAEFKPQQKPMVCPVEPCMMPMPCEPCMPMHMPCEPWMPMQFPCEPCMLPKPFMPCPPQPMHFMQPNDGMCVHPFMGQGLPYGMFPFEEE